jgi:type II secretory pathway pseudopilin PulG
VKGLARRGRERCSGGFSVIEITIAVTLLAIVVAKGVMLMSMASQSQSVSTSDMALEAQAQRVLDRISFAIMGCSRDTLFPDPQTPIDSAEMRYQVSLGVEEGEIVWGDMELISLDQVGQQQLFHEVNPGLPEATRTVWCNAVRPYIGGEDFNGVDDNANGLVDEMGLSFTLVDDKVTIRLTLERQQRKGPPLIKTAETSVTVRN